MFTESTEILVEDGWKSHLYVRPGLRVLSVDPIDSSAGYATVEAVKHFGQQPVLRVAQGSSLKYKTTKNSKIITKKNNSSSLSYLNLEDKERQELTEDNYLVTSAGLLNDDLNLSLADVELALWVTYFGSFCDGVTYFNFNLDQNPDRLGQLLSVSGLYYLKDNTRLSGSVSYSADIESWLVDLNVIPGSKVLPYWLYSINSIQAHRFIDEVKLALKITKLDSLEKSLADLLQVMYLKIGKSLKLVDNYNGTYALKPIEKDSCINVSKLRIKEKKIWSIKCSTNNVLARVDGSPVLLFCS
jgi:hypothetical protein